MTTPIKLTVRNKLISENRDLNIYHHSDRSAYIISPNNVITISLNPHENSDYIHLSIVSGPGNLEKECLLYLPSWCSFTFTALGNGEITHHASHIWVKIPPSPPLWQLKIFCPPHPYPLPPYDTITIGDQSILELL